MRNGNGGACLHKALKSLLNQALALGIKSRCSLVKDEDRRVLENGTRYTYPLALTARQKASPVTHTGVVALFALHDKVVGIGNPGSLNHLLHCCILHTKCYVVVECVVEEDCLLVDIANEGAQRRHLHILHVHTVNGYLALHNIIETGYKVYHGGLSATRLPYKRHGLSLLNPEVYPLQHVTLTVIGKCDVLILYSLFHIGQLNALLSIGNGVPGFEDCIYTFH